MYFFAQQTENAWLCYNPIRENTYILIKPGLLKLFKINVYQQECRMDLILLRIQFIIIFQLMVTLFVPHLSHREIFSIVSKLMCMLVLWKLV